VIATQPDAIAGRRHTFLVVYRGGSDLAAKAVMFAITVAAARQLSRDDFALFSIASTLGWLGAVAADFGIQVHLARAVSQSPSRGTDLLRRWLPVRAVTGAAALALSLAVVPLLGLGAEAVLPVLLFTVAYAASGMSECLYYFFRGLDRTDLESSFTLVQRASMGALAFGVLWMRPAVTALAGAMLLPAILTLWAAAVAARRLAARIETPGVTFPQETRAEFLTAVAPIGVGILLSALYFRIDVFLLERWTGSTAVALYNAVFRLVEALRLFPAAAIAVALPSLCRATDLRPLFRLAAPLTTAACGAALVLWLTAGWIVTTIYGARYVDAVAPFRILLFALPLMTLNYALTHQLIGWHGQRAYARLCAGALAFNVLLNWQLIPVYAMSGAAWSTVWTELFLSAGCVAVLGRLEPAGAEASIAPAPVQKEAC